MRLAEDEIDKPGMPEAPHYNESYVHTCISSVVALTSYLTSEGFHYDFPFNNYVA